MVVRKVWDLPLPTGCIGQVPDPLWVSFFSSENEGARQSYSFI